MKFVADRPFADPDATARELMELANAVEPSKTAASISRRSTGRFLYQLKGTPAEYKAGLDRAIANGWLWLHESGTL